MKKISEEKDKSISVLHLVRNIIGVLFLAAVVCLIIVVLRYQKMRERNAQINDLVIMNPLPEESAAVGNNRGMESDGAVEEEFYLPQIDFATLKALNESSVGWIYACGGKINYPIVASTDEFYLKHAIDGTAAKSGTIFVNADPLDAFPGNRSVIYGHNMRDGSMFHELLQYWRDAQYLENNPYVYIITEEGIYTYKVKKVYVAEYEDISFLTSTDPDATKILNLITCEYSGENTRLVVEAEQIED